RLRLGGTKLYAQSNLHRNPYTLYLLPYTYKSYTRFCPFVFGFLALAANLATFSRVRRRVHINSAPVSALCAPCGSGFSPYQSVCAVFRQSRGICTRCNTSGTAPAVRPAVCLWPW